MMLTWINGHLVLALIVIPVFSTWLVGFVNYRIRTAAHRRTIDRRLADTHRRIILRRLGVR